MFDPQWPSDNETMKILGRCGTQYVILIEFILVQVIGCVVDFLQGDMDHSLLITSHFFLLTIIWKITCLIFSRMKIRILWQINMNVWVFIVWRLSYGVSPDVLAHILHNALNLSFNFSQCLSPSRTSTSLPVTSTSSWLRDLPLCPCPKCTCGLCGKSGR